MAYGRKNECSQRESHGRSIRNVDPGWRPDRQPARVRRDAPYRRRRLGPAADRAEAVRVLRRAAELGVNFIDTADSYGPYVSEEIIHEALHPYTGLVIATKAGLLRTGPGVWVPLGNPSYLRQECEMSLRRLGVDAIDLFQLHRIDRNYPLADQVGELLALKNEGKIRHIGLSEIDVDQLEAAQQITEIVSVQNMYNLAARGAEPLLEAATSQGIAFIPWFPLASARWRRRTVRCARSPTIITRRRRSSPWRGYSSGRR
ncbi:aldo/keto reductase family protein [Mycobacterium ulcerans str. Harvey]|uniref:Aldo/keto reductase family protein n=1 Tax=Mycobacterium ulcerans str. Harvey TaxID=1299332 RepID=A0ABN0QUA5_MYCUL|nr:aldo/keto reductase family protein [Mycobacterium ulcerans str. Harvey]